MPRRLNMSKASEGLGASSTLADLVRTVARAIETYGSPTICGYNQSCGIGIHVHFPDGVSPHITFTQKEVPGSELPPGEFV
jgi:hypothetical protein